MTPLRGRPPGPHHGAGVRPDNPLIAAVRRVALTSGRRWRTRVAGLFLFLPLWARVRCDQLVAQADDPGSRLVPATSALRRLLAFKWLDKERRSHLSACHFAEALGLCAGLHILPQTTFATDSSSRTQRGHQHRLLAGWLTHWAPLRLPEASTFCLAVHSMPSRGDPPGRAAHDIAQRGQAGTRVRTCFAHEPDSRGLCYANAHLTRAAHPGALMRFVEFWHAMTGHEPPGLSLDSKLVPYAARSRVNQRRLWLVTIRRRGAALFRRLQALPPTAWRRTVIAIPQRRHQHVRSVDETTTRRGDAGAIRQVAVDGLGHPPPTLLVSNNCDASARDLMTRDTGRHGVEDSLGMSVNFFHLDCLASEVRLNVDVDVALTVLAHGCYRWLATPWHGFDKAKPKQLERKFVETGGQLDIQADRLVGHFAKRAHKPILREAALDQESPPIPWLHNLPVAFAYP
jgi:hypothetical protein